MYILTKRFLFPSARILRDSLQEITKEKILITIDPTKVKQPFIRFGNSDLLPFETQYNSANFVKFCTNKLNFSKVMKENNIPSPVYNKNKPEEYPILIRQTLFGSRGKGIVLVKDENTFQDIWNMSYFWTPFYKIDFELRVHILGGKIAKIFKKELEEDSEYPIRNNEFCHFAVKDSIKFPKLFPFVDTLIQIPEINCGKFYSLDVGWDSYNKNYFVFEMNSASGLNENTSKLYAEYLAKEMEL